MTTHDQILPALGFLRCSLLLLALLNVLPPLIDLLMGPSAEATEAGLWGVISSIVAPVMAPLLAVVLLFDYIMSRVRAADATGFEHDRFVRIGRIELAVMVLTLLFWVPFFAAMLG